MAITALMGSLHGYALPLLVAGVVMVLCVRFMSVKMDPREPPLVRATIPYFGHILGMLQHEIAYLGMLREKNPLPAFTMNLLSSKVYIVTHPALAQAAMRCKTLDFDPFVVEVADRMLGVSEFGMKEIRNSPENDKEETYLRDVHKSMHETLLPGNALLEMNSRVLGKLSEFVNEIGTTWEPRSLYLWLRDSFTVASSTSLYGRNDPFALDPDLIESLWDFELNQLYLIADVLPWLIAPKAYKGRAAIQEAFSKYYAAGHDDDASGFVKGRANSARKFGLSNDDLGKIELSIIFVTTTNAVPSVFWLLCYVLADEKLVSEIQAEVMGITDTKIGDDGKREMLIDIAKFNTECPLLVSAYHESLRLTNAQVSARTITEDTVLSYPSCSSPVDGPSSYLLKRGSVIQMPSGVMHTSPAVWGPDAHVFDARRFLPSTKESLDKDSKKVQSQGFFPFGGGKHLCPGRYFALAEILGMVSVIVAGYEVVQEGRGFGDEKTRVRITETRKQRVGEVVRKPASDPKVWIRRRADLADVKWGFKVGEGPGDFGAFQKIL